MLWIGIKYFYLPIVYMGFKLRSIHLFLALLVVLFVSNLGVSVKEFFENQGDDTTASALPVGIPKSEIPSGEEDMYILKSEVVPPVCPKCPDVSVCPSQENKCQPCPPCGRCPEPAFTCKKVPNYQMSGASDYLPRPVLNDFSQFGM